MVPEIAAAATAGAGILGIRVLWRRRIRYRGVLLAGCWGLVALSAGLWIAVEGIEFGIVFAAATVALCGLTVAAAGLESATGRRAPRPRKRPALPSSSQIGRQAAKLLAVVVGGAVAGVLGMLGLSIVLLSADQDRLALTFIGLPLAWGVAAYALCHARRLVLPAVVLVVLAGSGAGAMLLF